MVEFKHILCPVDFSDFSRRALQYAVALARWYDSDVTVFHSYGTPMSAGPLGGYPGPLALELLAPSPQELHQQVLAELRSFADAVNAPGVSIHIDACAGGTVQGILAEARTLAADLVVVGTHGRGGLDRLVLGSVTEKVLRKALCPVLTVPPPAPGAPEVLALLERILCPVDFSDASLKALVYALSLAQEADAQLLAMHVVEGLPMWDEQVVDRFDLSRYQQTLIEDARARLRTAIPAEARTWCKPEELVCTGKAYREILRVARERDAHLIVLGVHGRNPVDLMLFGSTTNHVVREAACPVLTLRG
jgi:nucleotide-binding universal stress UspA family protein